MRIIDRKNYIDRLIPLIQKPDIKIITGIRRSGKSELLHAFMNYIVSSIEDANIIFIDLLNLENEDLCEYHRLNEYILKASKEKNNFLFIDEAQNCKNFELVINSLYNKKNHDIYLTGSNAFLLSSDLSTYFTGRYFEISIFPFSFEEYIKYMYADKDFDTDIAFENYVVEGGLAGSYVYDSINDKYDYINNIFRTIIEKDLIKKYKIRNTVVLSNLSEYLISNIGNLFSSNTLTNIIRKENDSTNHVTLKKYLKYLCNSFLFYESKRYDIHGKKYMELNNKYYLADHSFKWSILGNKDLDVGRIYENIVYIELLRRGYEVFVGKLYDKEIDFVCKLGDDIKFMQVSNDISNESTLDREIRPLLSIKSGYEKIIIARTKQDVIIKDGIKIYDIARWLLGSHSSPIR